MRHAEARRRRQCARAGTRLPPATGAPVLPGTAEYTAQSICSLSSSEHMPSLDFIVSYPREPQPRPLGEHPWLSSHLRPQTGDLTTLRPSLQLTLQGWRIGSRKACCGREARSCSPRWRAGRRRRRGRHQQEQYWSTTQSYRKNSRRAGISSAKALPDFHFMNDWSL